LPAPNVEPVLNEKSGFGCAIMIGAVECLLAFWSAKWPFFESKMNRLFVPFLAAVAKDAYSVHSLMINTSPSA
jgi:hypothetical protein